MLLDLLCNYQQKSCQWLLAINTMTLITYKLDPRSSSNEKFLSCTKIAPNIMLFICSRIFYRMMRGEEHLFFEFEKYQRYINQHVTTRNCLKGRTWPGSFRIEDPIIFIYLTFNALHIKIHSQDKELFKCLLFWGCCAPLASCAYWLPLWFKFYTI